MELLELPQMQLNKTAMQSLEQRAGELIDQAPMVLASININNAGAAMEFVSSMKGFVEQVEQSELGVAKRVFDKAHKGISALMNRFTKPLDDDKNDGWIQRITRKVSQVKLAEEQRRQKEADDARAVAAKLAEEQKLSAAVQMEEMGNPVLAEAILNSPAAPVIMPPAKVEIANVSSSERWKARITDKVAFVKMAAERHEYMAYINIDEAELGRFVTKLKGKANIAGIEFWRDDIIRQQRRSA